MAGSSSAVSVILIEKSQEIEAHSNAITSHSGAAFDECSNAILASAFNQHPQIFATNCCVHSPHLRGEPFTTAVASSFFCNR